jgi:hypothetical protein
MFLTIVYIWDSIQIVQHVPTIYLKHYYVKLIRVLSGKFSKVGENQRQK